MKNSNQFKNNHVLVALHCIPHMPIQWTPAGSETGPRGRYGHGKKAVAVKRCGKGRGK